MHPNQVTPELIQLHGEPTILNSLGIPIVNFPSGRPGTHYAKRFGMARCLQSPEAQEKFDSLVIHSEEGLREVQQLEGLPDMVELVPDISQKLSKTARQARLSDLAWDQQFFNSFKFILQCMRDSKEGTSCYPLIQGPPGASKTQVAIAAAAVVARPVYPVVGGDGAADEIKAALLGGPFPSDKEPWAIAKENAYIGGLQEPKSERYLLSLLQDKAFEAISQEEFQTLAALEGIRAGITYEKKGAYQLAAENGGILLLEECNSFPAEVHSLLTQILENYINGTTHPNFFIIATQNPAGEKHPSRNPLPKEVVNRFEVYRVAVPSQEQYYQALKYMLTREQPAIDLGVKKGIVTPNMLGVDIPPSQPNPLVKLLTPVSVNSLVANLSKFHKSIEEKIESGVLDPKEVEEPPTKETTFISRRNLRRLLNGIENEIHSINHVNESGRLTWREYAAAVTEKSRAFSTNQISLAVWNAINRYYISPNAFTTHQRVEVSNKNGNETSKLLTNTQDLLMALAKEAGVDLPTLKQILMTATDIEEVKSKFAKQYTQAMKNVGATESRMEECLVHYQTLPPSVKELCAMVQYNNTVTLAYPLSSEPIQHLESICPLLSLKDNDLKKTETLLSKLEKRRKEIHKMGLSYLTTNDILSCKEWVNSIREAQFGSEGRPPLYFIPVYFKMADEQAFCLIASIHTSLLKAHNQEGKPLEMSADDKAKFEELMQAYSANNSYINANFVLTPRTLPNAISSPPMMALVNGTTAHKGVSGKNVSPLKLGKNSPATPALLEFVKFVPQGVR